MADNEISSQRDAFADCRASSQTDVLTDCGASSLTDAFADCGASSQTDALPEQILVVLNPAGCEKTLSLELSQEPSPELSQEPSPELPQDPSLELPLGKCLYSLGGEMQKKDGMVLIPPRFAGFYVIR